MKKKIGYKTVLREEGNPDPSIGKGSKKYVTDFEDWKLPIVHFQLIWSVTRLSLVILPQSTVAHRK